MLCKLDSNQEIFFLSYQFIETAEFIREIYWCFEQNINQIVSNGHDHDSQLFFELKWYLGSFFVAICYSDIMCVAFLHYFSGSSSKMCVSFITREESTFPFLLSSNCFVDYMKKGLS